MDEKAIAFRGPVLRYLVTAVFLFSCGLSRPVQAQTTQVSHLSLTAVSGNDQTAILVPQVTSIPLAMFNALRVQLTGPNSAFFIAAHAKVHFKCAIENQTCIFVKAAPSALSRLDVELSPDGSASATVFLGGAIGPRTVIASIEEYPTVTFTLTVLPSGIALSPLPSNPSVVVGRESTSFGTVKLLVTDITSHQPVGGQAVSISCTAIAAGAGCGLDSAPAQPSATLQATSDSTGIVTFGRFTAHGYGPYYFTAKPAGNPAPQAGPFSTSVTFGPPPAPH